jgi:4-hydroxy-2-oxovalerate aldolase
VGTDVSDVAQGEPFIRKAKKQGLFVAANFMKSYVLEPKQFAENARLAQTFGADVVYVVDSAGGMMPDEAERYIRAVQDTCDVDVGFHGHDNLGLAVANSLRAAELGAVIVDTSMQGMGRSAGNTPTEIFLLVLQRYGIDLGIDALAVMDIADAHVKPLLQRVGYDAVDMVSGFAQFHTSYMGLIREYSAKYHVDPRRLIIALCQCDKVSAPRTLVERLARALGDQGQPFAARFRLERYHGAEQDPETK